MLKKHANVGRNDPCPCGSGKKFKKCCEDKLRHQRFEASLLPPPTAAPSAAKLQQVSKSLFSSLKPLPKKEPASDELPPEQREVDM